LFAWWYIVEPVREGSMKKWGKFWRRNER